MDGCGDGGGRVMNGDDERILFNYFSHFESSNRVIIGRLGRQVDDWFLQKHDVIGVKEGGRKGGRRSVGGGGVLGRRVREERRLVLKGVERKETKRKVVVVKQI